MAYFQLEPWGEGFALLAAMMANALRDPKKKPGAYELADFLPVYTKAREQQEQRAMADALQRFGAKRVK